MKLPSDKMYFPGEIILDCFYYISDDGMEDIFSEGFLDPSFPEIKEFIIERNEGLSKDSFIRSALVWKIPEDNNGEYEEELLLILTTEQIEEIIKGETANCKSIW